MLTWPQVSQVDFDKQRGALFDVGKICPKLQCYQLVRELVPQKYHKRMCLYSHILMVCLSLLLRTAGHHQRFLQKGSLLNCKVTESQWTLMLDLADAYLFTCLPIQLLQQKSPL